MNTSNFRIITVLLLSCLPFVTAFSVDHSSISLDNLRDKRILVVGGSGRVGGSCVTQLIQRGSFVTIGGTNRKRYETAKNRWKDQFPDASKIINDKIDFAQVNCRDPETVLKVLQNKDYDLVVNTAGPFQGKSQSVNGVIQACVQSGVAYVDVCDDYCTSKTSQTKYADQAVKNGTPCLISTGCWPGVSSLMAIQLIHALEEQQKQKQNLTVDFSFFTAGSGGAGVTLLVATFLILSEKALVITKGRRTGVSPMRDYTKVDFGPVVGFRNVAPLNLLETASIHDNLESVSNTRALFGTAPEIWNALLGLMARLPSSVLANEEIMRALSTFSMPIVRLVDLIAGATNAMRCDVTCDNNNTRVSAIYAHENLEPCVGECVVAFCSAVLSGAVQPGVWFPEQGIKAGTDAAAVLAAAGIKAHTLTVESSSSSSVKLTREQVWGRPPVLTKSVTAMDTVKT